MFLFMVLRADECYAKTDFMVGVHGRAHIKLPPLNTRKLLNF